jgi:diguanylate cyclase (GGDEF)-like protein
MPRPSRPRTALLAGAIVALAAAVWFAAQAQRSAAERAFEQALAAEQTLSAMLEQQAGERGFALTGREELLQSYLEGGRDYELALDRARHAMRGARRGLQRRLRLQTDAAQLWRGLAETEVAQVRAAGVESLTARDFLARKQAFDRFRRLNADLEAAVHDERESSLHRASLVPVFLIVAISLLFSGAGYLLLRHQSRAARERKAAERHFREAQEEFTDAMQIMRNEGEAYVLLKRHLERSIDGAEVIVLNRNNSDNRLEPASSLPNGSSMAEKLLEAEPADCLAIRLAKPHAPGDSGDPLMACKLCGARGRQATCTPSLVGGEVIGSVLVEHPRPLDGPEAERIQESVAHAAPVLANLRNLAMAETRAATDALTGLANKRAVEDTLRRMTAQAGRLKSPLSCVLLDLDHFKDINDRYGHGAGDEVLAAVGDVLTATLRGSDFIGRYGGEELVALLPDTDRDGALQAAEKVRSAIEGIDPPPQVERRVTASFGIAVLPDDALDAESLLRMADRALYAAKAAGRNRIQTVDAELARDDTVLGGRDPVEVSS